MSFFSLETLRLRWFPFPELIVAPRHVKLHRNGWNLWLYYVTLWRWLFKPRAATQMWVMVMVWRWGSFNSSSFSSLPWHFPWKLQSVDRVFGGIPRISLFWDKARCCETSKNWIWWMDGLMNNKLDVALKAKVMLTLTWKCWILSLS